jgi:simple sugar transport system ATP-binding protein
MTARLVLSGISKRYGELVANDGIDLTVQAGQIHAVLGENGAGKSTLMKIIYGTVRPDAGTVRLNGQAVNIADPRQARAMGIAMVFQHFSLFETLTVAENVWLGLDSSVKLDAVREQIGVTTRRYGLELDADRHVHSLSVGERQRVEIIRALLTHPKLLILDEPTSVLTPQAVQVLFTTLRQLAAEGCSILYISHKLDEIRALCDACTVLRAGRVTGSVDPRQESNESLARLMIGSEVPHTRHRERVAGAAVLVLDRLSLLRSDPHGIDLQDLSLTVHAGEIVGVAGVSGNGQAQLLAALSGEDRHAPPASIQLDGQALGALGPAARRRLGMAFVPEERMERGSVPGLFLSDNVLLTHHGAPAVRRGWIRRGGLTTLAQNIIARFAVKADGAQVTARSLSGGNLQKFIVGREILRAPKLLVVAQPTWGVDVGAAARIHEELLALRDAGCAILLVSEELDELFEIADRLVVMAAGRLSPAVPVGQATVEQIGQWMSGLWQAPVAEDAHVAA